MVPSGDRSAANSRRGRASEVLVGTSGWVYPHWRERFYPPRLAVTRWLEFYASRLATVEVNATFYSLTTPRACERWRAAVPEDFLFAVKGSRYISHGKKLRNAEAALANFFASGILRLGRQLGPILWQLPPQLRFRRELAVEFLSLLPRDVHAAERLARRHDHRVRGRCALTAPDGRDRPIRYALEARHESWMGEEAAAILSERAIALVWADTAGLHPSTTIQTSSELAYARLHGSQRIYEGPYGERELDAWAQRAKAWARSGASVFLYFDNDRDAAAVLDAGRLRERIGRKTGARSPSIRKMNSLVPWVARERPAHFSFARRRTGDGGQVVTASRPGRSGERDG